jgi:hypothetical protein
VTVARRIEVRELEEIYEPSETRGADPGTSIANHSRLVGLAGTVAIHGFAVLLLLPDPLKHKTNTPDSAGASITRIHTESADELVIVTISGAKKSDSGAGAPLIDLGPQLTHLAIPLVAPDPILAISLSEAATKTDKSAQSATDLGDAETRARMLGRYTGQISARIERAWEKPRSPVSQPAAVHSAEGVESDMFVCQVQIRQDDNGNVQEVLLLACNGTEAWRRSLVVAINQSSPLPAPPIPTVFTRSITMTFTARIDQEGLRPDLVAVEPEGGGP